jgi:hypothetical protein
MYTNLPEANDRLPSIFRRTFAHSSVPIPKLGGEQFETIRNISIFASVAMPMAGRCGPLGAFQSIGESSCNKMRPGETLFI